MPAPSPAASKGQRSAWLQLQLAVVVAVLNLQQSNLPQLLAEVAVPAAEEVLAEEEEELVPAEALVVAEVPAEVPVLSLSSH